MNHEGSRVFWCSFKLPRQIMIQRDNIVICDLPCALVTEPGLKLSYQSESESVEAEEHQ